ncbi:uncharacterized protein LOC133185983 [Saccostrea echinata]|uniref:uncharacterized protein LOC133185983 n=1 Tax=Saccostrea echinata TaxID=191078 RepID=UPI002A804281|nr:uncharacterized protein LOC133185983 [Saccostrea echinata]
MTTTEERMTTTYDNGGTTQQNISRTEDETSTVLSPTTTFTSQTTSTALRTTEAYVIPCGVHQLSLAIQNATLACSGQNHTCNVTCNTGFVTSDGRSSREYKCVGESWAPSRELCLRYHQPIRTAQLHLVYEAEDQVASTCLDVFRNTSNQNKEQFQNSIADKCEVLNIKRDDIQINNITSSSLAFQLTNVLSVEFSGNEPDNVRQVCLNTIEILYKTIPTLLHPFSSLTCTLGPSNVTKVSARIGNSTYRCDNSTYLVKHLDNIYCVPCPPGRYMESSKCKACPVGTYQSLPGQLSCDTCNGNKSVVDRGTDCIEITTLPTSSTTDFEGNLGKSQVDESTGLTRTEIIIVAVVAIFGVILIITIAAIYYCKKSQTKRRTSHSDVSGSDKMQDDQSVITNENLTRSQEKLIPEKGDSRPEFGTYSDKNIERSTFTSTNETKALDVLKDIIDINIDNEECISSSPNMTNIQVRKGKWRPIRRLNRENVSDVNFEEKKIEKPEPLHRTLSDYDNFQISMPEFSDQEST